MHRFLGRCRRMLGDQAGNYSVEFALAIPVFMTFVMGIMEVAYSAYAKVTLETQVREAARMAIAKNMGCSADRSLQILGHINAAMGSFKTTAPTVVTVRSYDGNFGSVGQPEPFTDENDNGRYDEGEAYVEINGIDGWQADRGRVGDLGGPGAVVLYETSFQLDTLFPPMKLIMGDGRTLRSTTVVRNEPYDCDV